MLPPEGPICWWPVQRWFLMLRSGELAKNIKPNGTHESDSRQRPLQRTFHHWNFSLLWEAPVYVPQNMCGAQRTVAAISLCLLPLGDKVSCLLWTLSWQVLKVLGISLLHLGSHCRSSEVTGLCSHSDAEWALGVRARSYADTPGTSLIETSPSPGFYNFCDSV